MSKKSKISKITPLSQVTTLSLKFYFEQLLDPSDRVKYSALKGKKDFTASEAHWVRNAEKVAMTNFTQNVEAMDNTVWEVYAVLHDRDLVRNSDDIFDIAFKKPHIHVYARRLEVSKSRRSRKRFRVYTILKDLGLNYNPKADSKMWDSHGAEIIKQPFENSIAYAMHETKRAKLDGKEPYSISDVITNQSSDKVAFYLKKYKKGYKKTTEVDWDEFSEECYQLGLKCGDISAFFEDQLSVTLQTTRQAQLCRKKYEEGLAEGISAYGDITRVSVLIHGMGNLGKTENARKALQKMDKKTYIAARGSGKYDGLTHSTDAIIFDDMYGSDIRNVTDNHAARLHRRNSGDRPWLGDFVIATTNDDPTRWVYKSLGLPVAECMRGERALKQWADMYSGDDWLTYVKRSDHGNLVPPTELREALTDDFCVGWRQKEAVLSRLYICTIKPDYSRGQLILYVEKEQERGDYKSIEAHNRKFMDFKQMFDDCLSTYDISDARLTGDFGYDVRRIKLYRTARKHLVTNHDYELQKSQGTGYSRARVFFECKWYLMQSDFSKVSDWQTPRPDKKQLIADINSNKYIDGVV